jgi:hypothetical protein
MSGGI